MKLRVPLLLACGALAGLACGAGPATASIDAHRAPILHRAPTISGTNQVGGALRAHLGRWAGAPSLSLQWQRCSRARVGCTVVHRPGRGRTYQLSSADVGHRIRVLVRARNRWGQTTAFSRETGVIGAAPPASAPVAPSSSPAPPPGQTPVDYFATVPASQAGSPPAGIPRPDATCAAAVQPAAEVRPQNATANQTVPPSPSDVAWSTSLDYWKQFAADRDGVTGNFTGTTDEILQWVSCKWGIDVNLVRADAWVESRWIQSTVGDTCGTGAPSDEGSFGILQVKNKDCSGQVVHGGWPYTQNDTALDADYWGARLRACYDGAFYDGGPWLYDGQTIAQVIAAHGDAYALWGCIGSWYSGGWYDSGAQSYIASVQSAYSSQPWLGLSS